MSKEQLADAGNTIYYTVLGAITTGSVGMMLFEMLGAVILGIIGAIAGWVAKRFIIPYLDKTFPKK